MFSNDFEIALGIQFKYSHLKRTWWILVYQNCMWWGQVCEPQYYTGDKVKCALP